MKPIKRKMFMGITAALAGALVVFGNACGQMSLNDDVTTAGLDSCSGNIEFKVIEGAETASITYGGQVLDNMVACTGLQTVSQKTQDEYNSRRGSLSEYGNVLDVNPPLVMAQAAIAIEVCDDLYTEESAMSSNDRRIFNRITEGATPSAADIQDTLRRMARSCWGRDETPTENETVVQNTQSIVSSSDAATQSRHAAIAVCTSVLASLDGYRM